MKPSIQELFDRLSRRLDELESQLKKPEVQLGHRVLFSNKRSGEVPNAGRGNEHKFLRGDATWVAFEGGGLSEISGTNIGNGIGLHASSSVGMLTFRSISGSSGLTASLITSGTTVILSGSTGEANTASNTGSAAGVWKEKSGYDLRFRSVTVGDNVSGTENTNDIKLALPTGNVGMAFFGDGSDGNLVIDGTNTEFGMTNGVDTNKSHGAYISYVATVRDMYFNDLTVLSGITLYTANYRVFVKGTLFLSGTIGCMANDGADGELLATAPGAPGRAATLLGASGGGGDGGTTSTGVPEAGTSVTAAPPDFSNTVGVAGRGGAGGQNHVSIAGSAGGVVTPSVVELGSMRNIYQAGKGTQTGGADLRYSGGSGGGGGRGAVIGGGAQGGGGAGGAGGACFALCARKIIGPGVVQCYGGWGGAGYSGGGGGGGGGGGWVTVVIGTGEFPLIDVTGGTGGAAGGAGTSTSGSSGANGLSFLFRVSI